MKRLDEIGHRKTQMMRSPKEEEFYLQLHQRKQAYLSIERGERCETINSQNTRLMRRMSGLTSTLNKHSRTIEDNTDQFPVAHTSLHVPYKRRELERIRKANHELAGRLINS